MTAVWQQLAPAHAPSARYSVQTCLDPTTGNVILFGGYDDALGDWQWDTWEWDGVDWTELFPATTVPTAGTGHTLYQDALGWDGVNEQMMLVAKESGGVGFRFWLFDTATPDWSEITPVTVPVTTGLNHMARLTWSPDLGALVLFPGSSDNAWLWDGTDFTDTGEHVPEPGDGGVAQNVDGAMFVHDPFQDAIVQYGGSGFTGTSLFTGTFAQQSPAHDAGARDEQVGQWAAWLACLGGVAVYGGDDGSDNDTTYLYRDVGGGTYDWEDLAPAQHPNAIHQASMTTDRDGHVLLFGGHDAGLTTVYDETWLLRCGFVPQIYRRR
jgi:hypothetical protein